MTRSLTETAPSPAAGGAEIERLVGRGRQLQAEAMRAAFRSLFRLLVGSASLRVMRLPRPLPGQHQSCC